MTSWLPATLLVLGLFSCSPRPSPPPAIGEITVTDPMAFLAEGPGNGDRHDWPLPVGYVALANIRENDRLARQNWDFAPFGTFDASRGDGFQAAEIGKDGYIRFTSTQDGGTPRIQFFVGEHCGGSGWIVFGLDAPSGRWREVLATLSIAREPQSCPTSLNYALTRYRLEIVEYPFALNGQRTSRSVPTVISEHYDHKTIDEAQALERSYLGQGYGLLRWEAWGRSPPLVHDLPQRCGPVAYSDPPEPGWQLRDCRTYTNAMGR
ncbi:MAG: hypothetical protein ABI662_12555 [Dermatophilaceae bacterium]